MYICKYIFAYTRTYVHTKKTPSNLRTKLFLKTFLDLFVGPGHYPLAAVQKTIAA